MVSPHSALPGSRLQIPRLLSLVLEALMNFFLSMLAFPSPANTQLACHTVHTALQVHTALSLLYGYA